jgi:MarR family transcriptional regulator for hemolysin
MSDEETFGPLLHGTARAWRLKLDERLKPMGMSQAKWRTLLHLSIAPGPLTQAEIAERLGIEDASSATLLRRLENEGWIARKSSLRDRRCKMVLLGRRAHNVISQISAAAEELRHELLENISSADLRTCVRVLTQIHEKAERKNGNGAQGKLPSPVTTLKDEHRARGRASRRE